MLGALKKAKKKTVALIGLGIVVLASIVIAGLSVLGNSDSTLYTWDVIGRGDIQEVISASGHFSAKIKINIGTSVLGEIKELHVTDGQDVKAGDLLVTIDSERAHQEYIQTRAYLEVANSELERAGINQTRMDEIFARDESLAKAGLISDEEFRQARLNRDAASLSVKAAGASVDQAHASMKAMEDNLAKTKLVAPISGRVTGLIAEKGETVIPGQSNLPGATLMVISDMSEIIAEVMVNESEVIRIRVGQSAQVTAESLSGKIFPGKIVEVATASDRTGQSANMYKVKVALEMDAHSVGELRPGMNAKAVILAAEAKNVLRLPIQSVLEREGMIESAQKKGLLAPEMRIVVMTVQDGRAHEIAVSVGIANNRHFELDGGLGEGDKVITGPFRKLKDLQSKDSIRLMAKSDSEIAAEKNKALESPDERR
jgi:HlyD family secretion protein